MYNRKKRLEKIVSVSDEVKAKQATNTSSKVGAGRL